jgi:hypothetical protein
MGKPLEISSLSLEADPDFEAELAKRRALYALHDAGRILSDGSSFFADLDKRKVITKLVGEIQSIERKLKGLI